MRLALALTARVDHLVQELARAFSRLFFPPFGSSFATTPLDLRVHSSGKPGRRTPGPVCNAQTAASLVFVIDASSRPTKEGSYDR